MWQEQEKCLPSLSWITISVCTLEDSIQRGGDGMDRETVKLWLDSRTSSSKIVILVHPIVVDWVVGKKVIGVAIRKKSSPCMAVQSAERQIKNILT